MRTVPVLIAILASLALAGCSDDAPGPNGPAHCTDGALSGNETDIDCGGSCTKRCADAAACAYSNDCESRVCVAGTCQAPSCADGVHNGLESDVDCGGGCIGLCANGYRCERHGDCASHSCLPYMNFCRPESCNDGVRNGSETGVDCGGTCERGCTLATKRFGINIDVENPLGNPSADELSEANVGFVRFVYKESRNPVIDQLDPERLHRVRRKLDDLAQARIESLVVLNYETVAGDYVTHETDPTWWEFYRRDFATRTERIAHALGPSVTAYEIWNEPDHITKPGETYHPGIPAERFGELLKDAAAAIRPYTTSTIITGGTDTGDPNYLRLAADATGGELAADAVGIHPYGKRPDPDFPDLFGLGELDTIVGAYASFGKPVWITEMGIRLNEAAPAGADEEEQRYMQGEFLRRTLQRTAELDTLVERLAWFCWSDRMVNQFGIVDTEGKRTFAYTAFQNSSRPRLHPPALKKACFSPFTAADGRKLVRADLTVEVPEVVWTQPVITSPEACSAYPAGSAAEELHPSLRGTWRLGVASTGSTSFSGRDLPWRFALSRGACVTGPQTNRSVVADVGAYTVTGFIELAPDDDADPAKFSAGLVHEGYEVVQRDVGCQ